MRKIIIILLALSQPSWGSDCVVLLHGLGRTSFSMNIIEKSLEENGYKVVNNSYPSRQKSIVELSSVVGDGISECKKSGSNNIHFVTHSMGGILVRQYFQNHIVPEVKRVVMLAPPNQGSEVTTRNKNKWWYKQFAGIAGQELGIEDTSIPNNLKQIPLEIGIIAGEKSINPWLAQGLPKPNDGKVSVASAKLTEMKDFITVFHSHTFMANTAVVSEQVNVFLKQGHFSH